MIVFKRIIVKLRLKTGLWRLVSRLAGGVNVDDEQLILVTVFMRQLRLLIMYDTDYDKLPI